MYKANYKKANADYDSVSKTLYIKQPRTEFVPSFAYYVYEDLEKKKNIEIDFVVFSSSDTVYKKIDLKGKYDWSEL